jgi:hypothetical protein
VCRAKSKQQNFRGILVKLEQLQNKKGSSVISVKGSHILGVLPGFAGQHTQNVEVSPLKPEEP